MKARPLASLTFFAGLTLLLSACGDSIKLTAEILSSSQSADLQTFTYQIKVKETEKECKVKNVTVSVHTYISYSSKIEPNSTITRTHSFGKLDKGSTSTKTFTINTGGKTVNIFEGASLDSIDGETNCGLFGFGYL